MKKAVAGGAMVLAACLATGSAEAVPPPVPFYIIQPAAGQTVNLFETVATANGFLVTYSQSTNSVPPFTLYAQRFDATGTALGAAVKIDGPGIVGDHVEMVRLNKKSAAAVWFASVNGVPSLKIAKLNLIDGSAGKAKTLGRSDDHIHDVVRLANGNLAVLTPQIEALAGRYKVMVKIVNSKFGTVADWFSVNGPGFPLDAWAYLDQTVIDKNTGGIAVYRDHVTNAIVGRNFTDAGQLGTAPAISTTALAPFIVSDIAYIEVKGARLSDGKIAVCWVHPIGTGTDRYDVRCRILNANGAPSGSDFRVHESSAGMQTAPEVIPLANGLFTVTWVHADTTIPASIKYRTFASNGTPVFGERVASNFTDIAFPPLNTEAALLKDGSIAQVLGPSAFVPGIRAAGIDSPQD